MAWTLGNRLVKKVQSLGGYFWPNEPKLSHVIIGNIVFIIHAEIAGITSQTIHQVSVVMAKIMALM